jgi:hypothetical protein
MRLPRGTDERCGLMRASRGHSVEQALGTVEQALGADGFVALRPMDPVTITDDLDVRPLGRRCLRKPPRPRQRNTHA